MRRFSSRRFGRLVGLVLLVTVCTATLGTGLLHGKAPHSEKQCAAWAWTQHAKDTAASPPSLALAAAEISVDDPAHPVFVHLVPSAVVSIRGPPAA